MKTHVLIVSLVFSLLLGLFTQAQETEKKQTKRDSIRAANMREKYPVQIDTVDGKVVKYIDGTPGAHDEIIRGSESAIAALEESHSLYVSDKKTQFKTMIERVNKSLEDNKITEEQADESKAKFAEDLAEIITQHRAKTDAEINLIKVNRTSAFYDYRLEDRATSTLEISTKKGISINIENNRQSQKYIKTTSGFTLGFGYNYMNGDDLGINDFSYPNNNYFSLGYQWKTTLDKNNNFRLLYGVEYQTQGTELNGNRFFSQGDETQITDIGFSTEKAKFRQDQLVFPLHLEFGGSERKEYEDGRVRFQEYDKWKFGIGGFAGFNMSSRLKLKYDLDGREIKETRINNFDNEVLLYGVDAYVGRGDLTFFGRMNFNNVFKSNSVDAQYVTFGIRIQ
ncbi:hypothetical protein BST92_02955 [Nonlabens arenilitoris]|uniref:Outer membrane protein beta-barrel domain-containing protein n=1 Tax=Nonlabens arenilitoris TaxID=1217969 RepID=A0A2S7U9K7_9FLAO|nr:hypothetical protein [Nonlabens arenilitoris]PQJ30953.1 hypothetical protein BST92_02955 [Nonlabens arenilitoris]